MGLAEEIAPPEAQAGLFGEAAPLAAPPQNPGVSIYVHFEDYSDLSHFGRLVGLPVTSQTRWLRFPADERPGGPATIEEELEFDDTKAHQRGLFGDAEWWEEYWAGMPEFDQRDLAPRHTIQVDFKDPSGVEAFSKLLDQRIPGDVRRTPSIWFPEAEIGRFADKRYISRTPFPPKHPIYIVSKGRWDSRLTSKALHKLGVEHFIVVERAEFDRYAAAIDPSATLLVLDPQYQVDYDACDDLGMTKGKGPGPARNFAWDHSINDLGAAWHWVMDDNIDGFYRLTKNLKTPVADGTILRAMEDFCERYSNVGMAGPNYFMFASRKTKMPPLVFNTRIYSCNLIRNDVPYRWRGRYNEDTDISLRMLKDGLSTVQFNAFLQMKLTTQTLGGGNTAEFYAKEGTRPKSEMQVKLHPDVSRIVWKWGRWHHHVDYSGFRRIRPIARPGVVIPAGVNDYGMYLHVDAPKA